MPQIGSSQIRAFRRISYTYWLHEQDETVQVGLSEIPVIKEDHMLEHEYAKWVFPEQEVTKILVESFKEIPEVASICAQYHGSEIVIWTLLDSHDREARSRVYEKELNLCQTLRVYDLDFRATSIDRVSPKQLVDIGSKEIYHRQ